MMHSAILFHCRFTVGIYLNEAFWFSIPLDNFVNKSGTDDLFFQGKVYRSDQLTA